MPYADAAAAERCRHAAIDATMRHTLMLLCCFATTRRFAIYADDYLIDLFALPLPPRTLPMPI